MRYSGSKIKFVPLYQKIIKDIKFDQFIEPYVGSGAIYINNEAKSFIINDLNKELISVFKSFKHCNYNKLLEIKQFIFEEFGDIKLSKESYYNYRNWYNEHYHFTDKIEKGFYLCFIINSTINSFARWGPNGFNNSFGNRFFCLNANEFQLINKKLQKTTICNEDGINIINKAESNSLIFCDPPYLNAPTSYSNHFNENNLKDLLITMKKSKAKIIYTDIKNELNSKLLNEWKMIEIRQMANTSPNRKKQYTDKIEMVFTNFEWKNKIKTQQTFDL